MSQDANQSVTAPQLDDVNSSATDSSDHASIDTVEQDDQGKVGDANETMKSSDPALGAGTTMDKAKDRYDDINVGLGTGIKEGSPSGSGKKEQFNHLPPMVANYQKYGEGIPSQEKMDQMISQMSQLLNQMMKEREERNYEKGNTSKKNSGKDNEFTLGTERLSEDTHRVKKQLRVDNDMLNHQHVDTVAKLLKIELSETTLDSISQLKRLCSDIKRKELDVEKVIELPYVQAQRPDIERAFLNYYSELSTMENRTLSQSDDLSYFDVSKFPKHNTVKNIPSLSQWLKRMLHYKNAHCIPDYLIREELEAAAGRLSDPQMDAIVATAVEDAKLDESEPIKYARLLSYLEIKKPKIDYSDFQLLIDKTFKTSNDVRVLMVLLGNTIDSYLRRQNLKDIPKLSWIRIIKKLYRNVPEAMSTIEFQIPDVIDIRYRGEDGQFYSKTLNGGKVRRELNYMSKRLEKEISKAQIIRKDLSEVWNVVITTYDLIGDAIPIENLNENQKSVNHDNKKSKEKVKCKACGKSNHTTDKCFVLKKLINNDEILEKEGKYFNKATGKEIVLKENEFIIPKFNAENARPKQN